MGRERHDEEMRLVRVGGERVTCLCTLNAIASPRALASMSALAGVPDAGALLGAGQRPGALSVSPRAGSGGYVVTLRSIERVQRLVHRMTGAQARMRFSNIVGQSASLLEAVRLAHIAAGSASTVLVHGERGTGKEVFAQSIHSGSGRASGPFVAINCAAIPRELISSELFGYEGGSFTGADRQGRPGKFELANGGTLFLDEIGDMPRDLQTSLLRAIETRSVVRVGGQNVIPVDVRIIAATHKDLADEVRLGNFRSDLFFRLNVFPIEVPPLRRRSGDVELLRRQHDGGGAAARRQPHYAVAQATALPALAPQPATLHFRNMVQTCTMHVSVAQPWRAERRSLSRAAAMSFRWHMCRKSPILQTSRHSLPRVFTPASVHP